VTSSALELQQLEQSAAEVASMLRVLGNERRLMIVCKLVEWGEANVTSLAEAVGLSQSAVSQHLSKLRDGKIITYRRESQTLWYRLADPRIEKLFATLHGLFCRPPKGGSQARGKKKAL
jgi:ArsR family transcriptional regulator, virulence genes transcriptional regulator